MFVSSFLSERCLPGSGGQTRERISIGSLLPGQTAALDGDPKGRAQIAAVCLRLVLPRVRIKLQLRGK